MKKIEATSSQQSAVSTSLYEPGNVLIIQVRCEVFLELEAGVAEMCFNRAFGAIQMGRNLFYRQVLGVVEEKDLFASLCEMLDRCAKVCSKFLTFQVSAGIRMRLGDTAFIYGVQRFGIVFLFPEVVGADVFGDPIQP